MLSINTLKKADKPVFYRKRREEGNKLILPSQRKVAFVAAVRPSGSENGVTVAFISLHLLPVFVWAFHANVFNCMMCSYVDKERQKEKYL